MIDCNKSVSLKIKEPAKIKIERLVYYGSFILSALSVIYLISAFLIGYSWLPIIDIDLNNIVLSFIECFLGIAALQIPMLLKRIAKINIPDALSIFFYIFVICATVLGEMFSLYYVVPVWDSILHCGSGIMEGMFGSILLVHFFQKKKCLDKVPPIFIALGAVCFTLCIGTFWEIYEFSADYLLGLNMQKSFLQDGTALIGQSALIDTMKDLIVDSFGAIAAAILAFKSLKHQKGWLYNYKAEREVAKENKATKEKFRYDDLALPKSA